MGAVSNKPTRLPDDAVGYFPRALSLGTLPVRPTSGTTWTRRLGPNEVRVFADARHGVPYGQDRAILLLVSTLAVYQNSRRVKLGSAFSILGQLGLAPDGQSYRRLARRLDRVFNSAIIVRRQLKTVAGAPVVDSVLLCFDEFRLWVDADGRDAPRRGFVNCVTLSEGFWRALRRSLVTFPMGALRRLMTSPANLDLFLWLAMRSSAVRPGGVARIPVTGGGGLIRFLGLDYGRERDFRLRIKRWLGRIREVAPDWPAELDADGRTLSVWFREPMHAVEALPFVRDVRTERVATPSEAPRAVAHIEWPTL